MTGSKATDRDRPGWGVLLIVMGAGVAVAIASLALARPVPGSMADASPTMSAATPSAEPSSASSASPAAAPQPTLEPPPSLSLPDGLTGTIAYIGSAEDPQIFLLDLATGESRQLTELTIEHGELTGAGTGLRPAITCGGGPNGLTWSPDGSLLAFSYGLGCDGVVYTVGLDGTLHRIGDGHSPDWSPDGSRLVFAPNIPYAPCGVACLDPSLGPWELLFADPLGANPSVALTSTPPNFAPTMPHHSPDGTLIAFSGPSPNLDPNDLWSSASFLVNADGTGMRHIADGGYPQGWAPDGRLLFYIGEDDATVLIDVATGARETLGRGGDGSLELSPSGDRLLQELYDPVADAYSIEVLELPQGRLLATVAGTAPTWEPAGGYFVTIEGRDGDRTNSRMTIHAADGALLGAFVIGGWIGEPAWQPR